MSYWNSYIGFYLSSWLYEILISVFWNRLRWDLDGMFVNAEGMVRDKGRVLSRRRARLSLSRITFLIHEGAYQQRYSTYLLRHPIGLMKSIMVSIRTTNVLCITSRHQPTTKKNSIIISKTISNFFGFL